VLIALSRWHELRGHQQQTAASHQALVHLQAAYEQSAGPALADLAARTPGPEVGEQFATAVRATIPEHADRILTDPAWPALATTLAKAQSAGHGPRHTLSDAAGQRELDTADHPAEVLNWRIQHQTTEHIARRVQAGTARPHRNTRVASVIANTTRTTPLGAAQAERQNPRLR
jgi:hypothetical protein